MFTTDISSSTGLDTKFISPRGGPMSCFVASGALGVEVFIPQLNLASKSFPLSSLISRGSHDSSLSSIGGKLLSESGVSNPAKSTPYLWFDAKSKSGRCKSKSTSPVSNPFMSRPIVGLHSEE